MKDQEYRLLKSMLEINRQLYKRDELKFLEYLDNHEILSKKLKNSILSMEQIEILIQIDEEVSVQKFNLGMNLLTSRTN